MTDLARQYAQLIEAFNRMDWPRALALAGPQVEAAPEHPLPPVRGGLLKDFSPTFSHAGRNRVATEVAPTEGMSFRD